MNSNNIDISVHINITISKIMGIVIIFGAIGLGFYLKSESIVISLTGIGASMIITKTLVQQKKL